MGRNGIQLDHIPNGDQWSDTGLFQIPDPLRSYSQYAIGSSLLIELF